MATKHVLISGKVQGVYFRVFTKQKADELGLAGWVRNLPDGQVEALFQGKDTGVGTMLEWCKYGSPNARVDDLQVSDLDQQEDLHDFTIRG